MLNIFVDKVNTVMETHVGYEVHMFGSHAHSTLFRKSFGALSRALAANLIRKIILQTCNLQERIAEDEHSISLSRKMHMDGTFYLAVFIHAFFHQMILFSLLFSHKGFT